MQAPNVNLNQPQREAGTMRIHKVFPAPEQKLSTQQIAMKTDPEVKNAMPQRYPIRAFDTNNRHWLKQLDSPLDSSFQIPLHSFIFIR